jgi:DNA phosphorothioation-dependent restriction protein DptG
MTFQELQDKQKQERIEFISAFARRGLTVTQTSKAADMSVQSLVQFAQRHGIVFQKSNAGS